MKLKRAPRRLGAEPLPLELTARYKALRAVTGEDVRHGFWMQELLARRNAVARWRGQAGCTIRDVIQSINELPA
jgi:hypothetical protein